MSWLLTKLTKWRVRPAKTQISLDIRPVWLVFAVHMKKDWVLSYPLSAQRRLIRLGACPGWSESSLGAVILFVLSWGRSNKSKILLSIEYELEHNKTAKTQISMGIRPNLQMDREVIRLSGCQGWSKSPGRMSSCSFCRAPAWNTCGILNIHYLNTTGLLSLF